jgi:hypothetical protein
MPGDGGLPVGPAFAAAIARLAPALHLLPSAHGLLDYAECLRRLDADGAAGAAIGEAREFVGRLRCQPLLDRAADLVPAEPRIRGSMVTAPVRQQSAPVRDG